MNERQKKIVEWIENLEKQCETEYSDYLYYGLRFEDDDPRNWYILGCDELRQSQAEDYNEIVMVDAVILAKF